MWTKEEFRIRYPDLYAEIESTAYQIGLAVGQRRAKMEWTEYPLAEFIDECCTMKEDDTCQSSLLYGRYIAWYAGNISVINPSYTWFGRQMGKKFKKLKTGGIVKYKGIALKP